MSDYRRCDVCCRPVLPHVSITGKDGRTGHHDCILYALAHKQEDKR
jgi:hypothetical protein